MPTRLGELTRDADGRPRLRFTRTLPHPPAAVWRALTEDEQLAAWFPFRIEGERRAGAPLRFVSARADPIPGEMFVFGPESALEIGWEGETVRFGLELEPDGDGTILTLVNTFADVGKAARDGAGWHACLDLLAHELDGTRPPWDSAERWAEVHPRYVEAFGAEAATVGPPDAATGRE